MRLDALSAGTGAARGRFNGTVHSVFDNACNIAIDDGRLLALLAPRLANVPHGVRIDLPPGVAFTGRLVAGQRVGCRTDRLRFAGTELTIDLASAKPWRSDLGTPGIDLARPEVAVAWRVAWRAWRQFRGAGQQPTPVVPLRRAVERRALVLAAATRRLRCDKAALAIDRLVGCGPGLTPSGDDLIVGFLAGLWRSGGADPERRRFVTSLGVAVSAAARATSDVSRAYLIHAARGGFSEPIAILTRQLGDGTNPEQVERAMSAALRVGHQSGSDGVLGLLLGLRAWAPDGWPSAAVDRRSRPRGGSHG
ncbi:MAG TPA: DUF2877 domain-containing protein [Geminicoccaceae bacterium]|nr:DUF2877 domain-containing protein [Geminicoccaceae bacterium]